MNKIAIIAAGILGFASVGLAENEAEAVKVKVDPAKRAAALEKVAILQGGPKVEKPGSRKGVVTVVNAQTRADSKWIDAGISYLAHDTRMAIEQKTGAFELPSPKIVGDMSVYVVDDDKLPRVLVAPEDRWAMVNVAPLYTEKTQFFEARVKKELSRVFAMLCGGMSSSGYKLSLAGPIVKPDSLDVFPNETLPFDVTMRIAPYMEAWGVTPAVLKPYKLACQEGWAQPPTNKVMRAVWEEVHAVPTNPIVIKPETVKQK